MEQADSRFKVVPTGGIGRGKALNMAVATTKGRFIANLDADDVAHPRKLEVQIRIMEQYSLEFLSSDAEFILASESPVWDQHIEDFSPQDVTSRLLRKNPICHSTVVMSRDVPDRVGGYSVSRRSQIDYDIWFRLAKQGVCLNKINAKLAGKRAHIGQKFSRTARLSYVRDSVRLQKHIIDELDGTWIDRAYLVGRLGYGLLPRWIRLGSR